MTGAPNGRRSRLKGANAERLAAKWLREHGWPDARRYLAGDGRQPGDLDAIPGVCIDVKSREECRPRSFLEQVDAEKGDRLGLVWLRLPGVVDPGDWAIMLRARDLFAFLDENERLGEVERCAAGVVRTAALDVEQTGLVREWWEALKRALER